MGEAIDTVLTVMSALAGAAWTLVRWSGNKTLGTRLRPTLCTLFFASLTALWLLKLGEGRLAWLIFGSHLCWGAVLVRSTLQQAAIPPDPKQLPGERRIAGLVVSIGAWASSAFYFAWATGYWRPQLPEPMFVDTGEPLTDTIVNWGPILLIGILWIFFYRRLKRR